MTECNCANERIIPNENTPVGSKHLKGCPNLKPYLFYWEEEVSAWVPSPLSLDAIINTDNLDQGEEQEIKFKRFDMTEEEYKDLPVE